MKKIVLSAGILALFVVVTGCAGSDAPGAGEEGTAAQDVVTARCPANIFAKFSKLDAYSLTEIEQHEGFVLLDDEKEELRAPLRQIETMPGDAYEAFLNLKTADHAECAYESGSSTSKVTAKFYTKSGKNILRIDADDPQAKRLSFYVTVKSYTETSVTSLYTNAAIVYREENSEGAFNPRYVGRASKLSLSVAVPQ